MGVRYTGFYEGLGLLVVLAVGQPVGFVRQADDGVNQGLGHYVQIDKEATSGRQDIEGFVKVPAKVYLFDDVADDLRNTGDLSLRACGIDLVVESLRHFEDGMDHETVLQFFIILDEKGQHHLAKLRFDTVREVIEKPQKVLKPYKLGEIFRGHHDFDQEVLQLHVETVSRGGGELEVLNLLKNLLDEDIDRVSVQVLD